MSANRDYWLETVRRSSRAGEEALSLMGSIPMSFIIMGDDHSASHFACDLRGREHMMDVFDFIFVAAAAEASHGVIMVGIANASSLKQGDDESEEAFRRRVIDDNSPEANKGTGVATVAVYYDDTGARQSVAQYVPVLPDGDDKLAFGRPEISGSASQLFGGFVELLPEKPFTPADSLAAAIWLVANAEKRMKEIGLHLMGDVGRP